MFLQQAAFRRQRQEDHCKLETGLVHIVSFGSARLSQKTKQGAEDATQLMIECFLAHTEPWARPRHCTNWV